MMKDDQGDWKVAGKDYFSVTGPAGINEGDRVFVRGRMKTKLFDKKDGSKGVSLNVRAEEMKVVKPGSAPQQSADSALADVFGDTLKGIDDQAPF
jgi:single-stranded DNA-binding protein